MKIKSFLVIVVTLGFNFCSPVKEGPIKLTAFNSMERIDQYGTGSGKNEIIVKGAKNEYESVQVAITAIDTSIRVTKAEMSELTGENNAVIGKENFTFYREEYIQVRLSSPRTDLPPGLYTDPLVPFINPVTGEPIEPYTRKSRRWGEPVEVRGAYIYPMPIEVSKGQHQIIWIDVYIPKTAGAGEYKGIFSITTSEKQTVEMPVTLTVWDFEIPDAPTHRNHFGTFSGITQYFEGVTAGSEKFRELEMRYCEEMAKHRLCPPIPSNLLPEVNNDGSLRILPGRHAALKEFMVKNHKNDFQIPRSPFAQLPRSTTGPDYKTIPPGERQKAIRYYREYYKYLQDNGWEKQAYLYMWDEPNLKENYEQVLVLGEMVREANPGIRILVVEPPILQDSAWPDMDPVVDIWCPLWPNLEKSKDAINEKNARGDEVWSYTALVQGSDEFRAPYWHIDRPLAVYRVPTWMNWQYNISGLLYWSTVTGTIVDPWWNPAFRNRFNGGGYLFYPGTLCGIEGPVTSMRMKVIRDSMEDWEYFEILKNLKGREAVTEIVNAITTKYWIYSEKPEDYLVAREKLAEAILKAGK